MSNNKILAKLFAIQQKLHVPKGRRNNYGGYEFRNASDILETVKPLLAETMTVVKLDDEIVEIGDKRFYLKATATITDIESGEFVTSSALAREDESRKGMDGAQLTGACSSYARKYALGGMFGIDDSRLDPDATNKGANDCSASSPTPAVDYGVCPCGSVKGKAWADIDDAMLSKILASEAPAVTDGHRERIRTVMAERLANA